MRELLILITSELIVCMHEFFPALSSIESSKPILQESQRQQGNHLIRQDICRKGFLSFGSNLMRMIDFRFIQYWQSFQRDYSLLSSSNTFLILCQSAPLNINLENPLKEIKLWKTSTSWFLPKERSFRFAPNNFRNVMLSHTPTFSRHALMANADFWSRNRAAK